MSKRRAILRTSAFTTGPSETVAKAVADAIQGMLDGLPSDQHDAVLRALKLKPSEPAGRPGTLANAILRIVPKDATFTVEEIKEKAADEGVKASDKEIHNAFGYLTRKQQIRRLAYGVYAVEGVGVVVTSDDLGGEPGRNDVE